MFVWPANGRRGIFAAGTARCARTDGHPRTRHGRPANHHGTESRPAPSLARASFGCFSFAYFRTAFLSHSPERYISDNRLMRHKAAMECRLPAVCRAEWERWLIHTLPKGGYTLCLCLLFFCLFKIYHGKYVFGGHVGCKNWSATEVGTCIATKKYIVGRYLYYMLYIIVL